MLVGLRVANLLAVTTMSMTGRNYCKNAIWLRANGTADGNIMSQINGSGEPSIQETIARQNDELERDLKTHD